MQIHGSALGGSGFYQSPFAVKQNADHNDKTVSINGAAVKAKQEQNTKSNPMKNLMGQIQRLQEEMEKVKKDEKLTEAEKNKQLQKMQEELAELQKQIAEISQKEEEEKAKKKQEKQAEEEIKRLSPEEQEKKIKEIEHMALVNFAAAAIHMNQAESYYFKLKKCRTEGQLGMGPKYGGNLSAAEVAGHFQKAAKYASKMTEELKEAEKLSVSAGRVIEAYKKHKKEEKIEQDQDKKAEEAKEKEEKQ